MRPLIIIAAAILTWTCEATSVSWQAFNAAITAAGATSYTQREKPIVIPSGTNAVIDVGDAFTLQIAQITLEGNATLEIKSGTFTSKTPATSYLRIAMPDTASRLIISGGRYELVVALRRAFETVAPNPGILSSQERFALGAQLALRGGTFWHDVSTMNTGKGDYDIVTNFFPHKGYMLQVPETGYVSIVPYDEAKVVELTASTLTINRPGLYRWSGKDWNASVRVNCCATLILDNVTDAFTSSANQGTIGGASPLFVCQFVAVNLILRGVNDLKASGTKTPSPAVAVGENARLMVSASEGASLKTLVNDSSYDVKSSGIAPALHYKDSLYKSYGSAVLEVYGGFIEPAGALSTPNALGTQTGQSGTNHILEVYYFGGYTKSMPVTVERQDSGSVTGTSDELCQLLGLTASTPTDMNATAEAALPLAFVFGTEEMTIKGDNILLTVTAKASDGATFFRAPSKTVNIYLTSPTEVQSVVTQSDTQWIFDETVNAYRAELSIPLTMIEAGEGATQFRIELIAS